IFTQQARASAPPRAQSTLRALLALYVYEYLLHVGAQKSAQTFLSEIRWEKNITLGEPPGFLHSWWCVFWDLYCAAPDRRETCEHSSEAKAFHDYSAAAAPSPVMGNMPPNDGMPGGPMPPGFFQPFMSPRYPGGPRPSLRMPNQVLTHPQPLISAVCYCCFLCLALISCSLSWFQPPVGVPGPQPLLPNSLDPTRPQGHPNMGGPMRMNPPRGMGGMGPQNYGGGMRPPPNSLGGPGMPGMNMVPGGRGPWPNPNANSVSATSNHFNIAITLLKKLLKNVIRFLVDSTNSSENIYTMMNPIGPGGNRPNFPMGPGPDGPMGGMGSMEPHLMNGSLGSGDMDGLPKNSPNNMAGMNNPPGTPRDDGEMAGNFLNPFQSESVSPHHTCPL
uniref:Single-stranded DNA-binding protein 3-like n=1 Tax=Sinocyclocheilus anshuiensis TaxID=1608454 RepID=A0A671P7J2_9TELE